MAKEKVLEQYKKNNWDLESLLKGKSIENLFDTWKKKCNEQIVQFKNFYKSLPNFSKWERLGEEIEIISNRLYNYVSNKISEDVSDPIFLAWEQKINMQQQEFSIKLSSLSNVILDNEKKIRTYLKTPSLKKYTTHYERFFRYRPHILSSEQNKVLSQIGINRSSNDAIFTTLTNEDIKFQDALDKNKKAVPIPTMSHVQLLLKNNDRVLRKNVWLNYNSAFNCFSSTLTQLLYYNYMDFNTHAKLHNYKDYVDKTTFNDEIDEKLILNLYQNVARFKPLNKEYKETFKKELKKQLKLDKLEPWDLSMELSKTPLRYNIEQAKKMVLDIVNIFGAEYVNIIKKAFNEKWISWFPKPKKRSGAYSIGGTKGLDKYYIMMNFNGTYDDVSTLIHELGHSLNSYYFTKYNPTYASTSIFTAEIPSIVNETLLVEHMIKNNINNKSLVINFLDQLLSNFFNTTSRQIIFSNFEYEANKLINNSQPFNKDTLLKIYQDMNEKYVGIKDLKKYNSSPYNLSQSLILRIPHFYAGNFYVYKYAIGQIVAVIVAKKLLEENNTDFKNKYFAFLKSGTSLNPLDTIKILGIDLYDKKTYDIAFDYISEKIKLFTKLVNGKE